MRKLAIASTLFLSLFVTGCGTHGYSRVPMKASDTDVTRTVTGKVTSIEVRKRSALTATNVVASNIASTNGGTTLGLLAFAVDVLDHQSAKGSEIVYEVKLINEVTLQEETMVMDIPEYTKFASPGERVRLIHKKYGAESAHNLTRFPSKDELTR